MAYALEASDSLTENPIVSMAQTRCSAQEDRFQDPTLEKSKLVVEAVVDMAAPLADLWSSHVKSVDNVYQRKGCVISSQTVLYRQMKKIVKSFRSHEHAAWTSLNVVPMCASTRAGFVTEEQIAETELTIAKDLQLFMVAIERFDTWLLNFSLTHLNFGREFTGAVEAKHVAQQEAEQAKFVVEREEQFKLAR